MGWFNTETVDYYFSKRRTHNVFLFTQLIKTAGAGCMWDRAKVAFKAKMK